MELLELYREGLKQKSLKDDPSISGFIFDPNEVMDEEHYNQLFSMTVESVSQRDTDFSGINKTRLMWAAEHSDSWEDFIVLLLRK